MGKFHVGSCQVAALTVGKGLYTRWTPHPVIVTIRRVLLHSYYATITGWGVLLTHIRHIWGVGEYMGGM